MNSIPARLNTDVKIKAGLNGYMDKSVTFRTGIRSKNAGCHL